MKHSRRRFTPILCVLFGHRFAAILTERRTRGGCAGMRIRQVMACERCGQTSVKVWRA